MDTVLPGLKFVSEAVVLQKALEEKLFSHLFQLLEVAHIPWLVASSFVSQPSNDGWSP